jgi:hypothetical protein
MGIFDGLILKVKETAPARGGGHTMDNTAQQALRRYKDDLVKQRDLHALAIERGGTPAAQIDALALALSRINAVDYVTKGQ